MTDCGYDEIMAIPIINSWQNFYPVAHEGLGSSYERIVLNRLLLRLCKDFNINRALEAPCFGFTGVSGINLVALAKAGVEVHLEDHDPGRLEFIRDSWQSLNLPVHLKLNDDYRFLDYPDASIDFGFNFSAIWFVKDLPSFVAELCRVVNKCILICVPNRNGIGYKGQLKGYSATKYPELHPGQIDPASIIWLMRKNKWQLLEESYIDCPPWPDIGMSKEEYLRGLFGAGSAEPKPLLSAERSRALSILPYYRGEDPGFAKRMLRFQALELIAPRVFKKVWAHHRYLLFTP